MRRAWLARAAGARAHGDDAGACVARARSARAPRVARAPVRTGEAGVGDNRRLIIVQCGAGR